jgi:hypothetical protein
MDSTSPVHEWGTFRKRDTPDHSGITNSNKEGLNSAKRPHHEAETREAMRKAMEGKPDFCGGC